MDDKDNQELNKYLPVPNFGSPYYRGFLRINWQQNGVDYEIVGGVVDAYPDVDVFNDMVSALDDEPKGANDG